MRIIGVELRVLYCDRRMGTQRVEVGIVPCDIQVEIPDVLGNSTSMDGTLHTDRGDIAIPQFPTYSYFFDPLDLQIKHRSR
jgi:hypothetical protein